MIKYAQYFGLAGLFCVVIGLAGYSITSLLSTVPLILLLSGLVLLVTWIVLRFSTLKMLISSRSGKFGSNAAITIVLLLGILILVNIVANRFTWRVDTTAAKQFSLSDQTKKVLKNLEKKIEVSAFFKSGEEGEMKELLAEYSYHSDQLSYQFIDPDKKPGIAKSYDIKVYGTTVIRCGLKEEKITRSTEEELTNAIIKVTRDQVKKIYFSTGHGERDYDNIEADGFEAVKKNIENENYLIEKILLAEKDKIPDDCSVLVIAGPETDLFENERQMITDYLEQGGKALFLLDPSAADGYADYFKNWGITIGKDIVIDGSGFGQLFGAGPTVPLIQDYDENHDITKDFRIMTFFREARSVTPVESAPIGMEVQSLIKTNPHSWGETELTGASASFDEAKDLKGPVSLAAVISVDAKTPTVAASETPGDSTNAEDDLTTAKKTRLVVFGDSDFATNSFFSIQGNGNLFMNALSWLAEEEDLISVRPRDPEDRRVNLSQGQQRTMFWTGVVMLPLVIFSLGIMVYRRRK